MNARAAKTVDNQIMQETLRGTDLQSVAVRYRQQAAVQFNGRRVIRLFAVDFHSVGKSRQGRQGLNACETPTSMLKMIISGPGCALASRMAWRNVPIRHRPR